MEKLKLEQEDLQEKILKLHNFIGSDEFRDLQLYDRILARQQHEKMVEYNGILITRIERAAICIT